MMVKFSYVSLVWSKQLLSFAFITLLSIKWWSFSKLALSNGHRSTNYLVSQNLLFNYHSNPNLAINIKLTLLSRMFLILQSLFLDGSKVHFRYIEFDNTINNDIYVTFFPKYTVFLSWCIKSLLISWWG